MIMHLKRKKKSEGCERCDSDREDRMGNNTIPTDDMSAMVEFTPRVPEPFT
jgi:hypothetical protein